MGDMTENLGLTEEELDDLAWALVEAFPEVTVNPVHAPDFWPAKATQLLPVINKIRDRARAEGRGVPFDEVWDSATADLADQAREYEEKRGLGREITLEEAVEKAIVHEPGCGWETGPYCTCGADPERSGP